MVQNVLPIQLLENSLNLYFNLHNKYWVVLLIIPNTCIIHFPTNRTCNFYPTLYIVLDCFSRLQIPSMGF